MNIIVKETINAPISEVWKAWAEDFDQIGNWASQVVASVADNTGEKVENAPMCGRKCDLSSRPEGPYLDERIVHYDREKHELDIKVIPVNAPVPIHYTLTRTRLVSVSDNTTEMHVNAEPKLKFMGYIMYPMLKMGFTKSFKELTGELKHFVEQGKPHPRKVKKMR